MAQRIIVVDDDEESRTVLKRLLEKAGYEVRLAIDGVSGLNLVLESRPSLVISDWRMPIMDGKQFVESLRSSPDVGSVPVIMLTGRKSDEEARAAREAGVTDFIVKPFKNQDLLDRVRAALGEVV